MPIIENVEARASHFMLNGEQYGACSLPQRSQVYALIDCLDGLAQTKHIPSEVVGFACGLSAMSHRPIALITHEPSFSTQEKSDILMVHQEDITTQLGVREVSVLPLKTITLRFEHEGAASYILFTRTGDHLLDWVTKSDITPVLKRLLQTERNPLRRGLAINPLEIDPVLMFGIEPGLVSPFVRANLTSVPKGLLYYWENADDSFDDFVAIAVSPTDTLVVHKTVFHRTLDWWQGNFLGVPYRTVVKGVGVVQAL